jgi:hypothetical protein
LCRCRRARAEAPHADYNEDIERIVNTRVHDRRFVGTPKIVPLSFRQQELPHADFPMYFDFTGYVIGEHPQVSAGNFAKGWVIATTRFALLPSAARASVRT